MNPIVIDSKESQKDAIDLIRIMEIDGSMSVQIKRTDRSGTAKQRRLQWLWYSQVADSGLGSSDTKEGVHLESKWDFCKDILIREDRVFEMVFNAFIREITGQSFFRKARRIFCQQYISTEALTKRQRAEYLTNFQRFWTEQGVGLVDPASQGVDLEKFYREEI